MKPSTFVLVSCVAALGIGALVGKFNSVVAAPQPTLPCQAPAGWQTTSAVGFKYGASPSTCKVHVGIGDVSVTWDGSETETALVTANNVALSNASLNNGYLRDTRLEGAARSSFYEMETAAASGDSVYVSVVHYRDLSGEAQCPPIETLPILVNTAYTGTIKGKVKQSSGSSGGSGNTDHKYALGFGLGIDCSLTDVECGYGAAANNNYQGLSSITVTVFGQSYTWQWVPAGTTGAITVPITKQGNGNDQDNGIAETISVYTTCESKNYAYKTFPSPPVWEQNDTDLNTGTQKIHCELICEHICVFVDVDALLSNYSQ